MATRGRLFHRNCFGCASIHTEDCGDHYTVQWCGKDLEVSKMMWDNWDRERGEDVMNAFREILTAAGIQWKNEDAKFDAYPIYRTHFTIDGKHFSVIIGFGSYGFEDYKLEMWAKNDPEPIGHLTITEAWELIKEKANIK